MKDTIEIAVETRHFKAATRFSDNTGCPLYQAMREHFSGEDISVGGLTVHRFIEPDTINYKISNDWTSINPYEIDNLIAAAKGGEEIETHYVTLTKNW